MKKKRKEKRKAFMVRLPTPLANQLEKMSLEEERSFNVIIQRMIKQYLAQNPN